MNQILGNVALSDGKVHRVGMVAKDGVFSLEAAEAPTTGITRCGYPYAYGVTKSGEAIGVAQRNGERFALTDGFVSDLSGRCVDDPVTCDSCMAVSS